MHTRTVPLFRRRRQSQAEGASASERQAKKAQLDALREFAGDRRGVEAYIEPPTSMSQTTMLLIASDGESIRRRVKSASAAETLARKLQIPCYDINRVGYPQRMRDYNLRQKRGHSQASSSHSTSSSHISGARFNRSADAATGRAQSSTRTTRRSGWASGSQTFSGAASGAQAPTIRSADQQRAIATLISAAGTEPLADEADERQLQALLRKARASAHPDRKAGDRTLWDRVEEAARTLRLET